MWIVQLALPRPYTFVVLALLIGVLGVVSIVTMTVDIFPAINIPVVTVIWNYAGLSPTEMQARIVTVSERAFTTCVTRLDCPAVASARLPAPRCFRGGARS
jgi:multidrug efflux pump subunit AcrB